MKKGKWLGSWPTRCDLCDIDLSTQKWFADALIPPYRKWGLVCPTCFGLCHCKLGTGRGQKYDSETLEKLDG